MVKVKITNTSDRYDVNFDENACIKSYEHLEDCVRNVFANADFNGWNPSVIIMPIDKNDIYLSQQERECDFIVEIYDDYRE